MSEASARRLALAELFIELMQPGGLTDSCVERLILCAVVVSTYGPAPPFTLNKIAQITSIPRTTVRRALNASERSGWIVRQEDNTFVIAPDCPFDDNWFDRVGRQVQSTAGKL